MSIISKLTRADGEIWRAAFVSVCVFFGTFIALFSPAIWLSYQVFPEDSTDRLWISMPATFIAVVAADHLGTRYKRWKVQKIADKINEE